MAFPASILEAVFNDIVSQEGNGRNAKHITKHVADRLGWTADEKEDAAKIIE